jgi:hypothetical protein
MKAAAEVRRREVRTDALDGALCFNFLKNRQIANRIWLYSNHSRETFRQVHPLGYASCTTDTT